MKKFLLILSILLIMGQNRAQHYYYGFDQKIELFETSFVIIPNYGKDVTTEIIVQTRAKLIDSNAVLSVIECDLTDNITIPHYPVYRTDDGILLGMWNEVVFQAKDKKAKDIIVKNFPITIIEDGVCYTRAEIKEKYDALEIANKIQESGYAIFSHPNFIVSAEFFDNSITSGLYMPSDEYFEKQYYLYNHGQFINDGHSGTFGADIRILPAWLITRVY